MRAADLPGGGPAFPLASSDAAHAVAVAHAGNEAAYIALRSELRAGGLTVRDYFAAKAMAGLIPFCANDPEPIAACAYGMADAMLRAREVQP